MTTMDEDQPRTIKRAAIRDIAALAGVSIATVSRVINGRPDVADATRQAVLAQVRRLGYVTNRSARALAGGRTGLVGIVVPFPHDSFFAGIIEGAAQALFERDARPVLCPTQHQRDRELSVLERLMHGSTDGSLLVTPRESMAELNHMRRQGAPLVVIDPSVRLDDDVPVVTSSNWAGGRMAIEHLISLGHRRIATVTGCHGWCAAEDRLAGYYSALLAAGLPQRPEYILETDFQYEGGYLAGQALLALPEPPTAIFAQSDNLAIGVMRAARARGLRVPEDLSVVGFNDVEVARVTTPTLTTISQPLQALGHHAVSMLYRQIEGQPLEASRIELSTRLVVRQSTAPPTA
jgi:LacI family transcriptional regulator